MEELLNQIEIAHHSNLYYLSLFSTLTLPDICGALASPDGRANGARYRSWYEKFVIPRYDILSPEEAYNFRCSALHQGSAEPDGHSDYDKVIFLEPHPQIQMSINVKRAQTPNGSIIMVDLKLLVPAIIQGVRQFVAESQGTEPFVSNFKGFMRRYPYGYLPWTSGAPTIA